MSVPASGEPPDFVARLEAEMARHQREDPSASSLGVGEIILSARELAGLSQRALAQRSHTSQAAITAMETGRRVPTIRALGALVASTEDALADYIPLVVPSVFEGAPAATGPRGSR